MSEARLGLLNGAGRMLGGRVQRRAHAGAHSAPMISSRVLLVLDTASLGELVEVAEP
jgi:hypothetical protein